MEHVCGMERQESEKWTKIAENENERDNASENRLWQDSLSTNFNITVINFWLIIFKGIIFPCFKAIKNICLPAFLCGRHTLMLSVRRHLQLYVPRPPLRAAVGSLEFTLRQRGTPTVFTGLLCSEMFDAEVWVQVYCGLTSRYEKSCIFHRIFMSLFARRS